MELIKKKRKGIDIDSDTKGKLTTLATNADFTLKPFIERQLIKMAENGVSYEELFNENEALRISLKQLTDKK